MGASGAGTSGGLKGLLGDEGFMSAAMKKGGSSGGGQAYQRGFQGGDPAGMQSYQDMLQMGFQSQPVSPMQGLSVLNSMQYQPRKNNPFHATWSYQPIIRRR